MVLLPIILASIVLVFIVMFVITVLIVVDKIGLSILSARMGIKRFGLLWIPVVGSWFAATIVGRLLGRNNAIRILYFALNVITMILFSLMMAIPYEMDLQAIVRDIAYIFALISAIIKGIIRICAMKKSGFNLAAAICINILAPVCWSYCMLGKVAKASRI